MSAVDRELQLFVTMPRTDMNPMTQDWVVLETSNRGWSEEVRKEAEKTINSLGENVRTFLLHSQGGITIRGTLENIREKLGPALERFADYFDQNGASKSPYVQKEFTACHETARKEGLAIGSSLINPFSAHVSLEIKFYEDGFQLMPQGTLYWPIKRLQERLATDEICQAIRKFQATHSSFMGGIRVEGEIQNIRDYFLETMEVLPGENGRIYHKGITLHPIPSRGPLPRLETRSIPSRDPLARIGTRSIPSRSPLPRIGTKPTPFTVWIQEDGTILLSNERFKNLKDFFESERAREVLQQIQPFSKTIKITGRIPDVQNHFLEVAEAYLDFARSPPGEEKREKYLKYKQLVLEKGFQEIKFVVPETEEVEGPELEMVEPACEVAIHLGSEGFETEGYLMTQALSDELGPILGRIKELQPSLEKIKITGKRTNIVGHLLKIAKAYLTFCQTSSKEKYEEAVRESGLEVAFCVEGEVEIETFHENGELDALFTKDPEAEMESSVSTALLIEEEEEISEKPAKKSRRKEPAAETEIAEFDEIEAPATFSIEGTLGENGKIAWKNSIPSAHPEDIEDMVQKILGTFTGESRKIQIQVVRENPNWGDFVDAMEFSFRRFFYEPESYSSWTPSNLCHHRDNYLRKARVSGFLVDFIGTHEHWPRKGIKIKRLEDEMQRARDSVAASNAASSSKRARIKKPAKAARIAESSASAAFSIEGTLGEDGKIVWKSSVPLANLRAIEWRAREILQTGKLRGIQIQVIRENPNWEEFAKVMERFRWFFRDSQGPKRSHADSALSVHRGRSLDRAEEAGFLINFIGEHDLWPRESKRTKALVEKMQRARDSAAEKDLS